jgi:hypothetical protein
LLCFFFGTAMVLLFRSWFGSGSVFEIVKHELQVSPAWVHLRVVARAFPEVAVTAANAAQTLTIGAMER